MQNVGKIERGEVDWCESGYHKITYQVYQGVRFYFGSIGSMTCLLDDNLDPVTGIGYHAIDLVNHEAETGAIKLSFTEHLNMPVLETEYLLSSTKNKDRLIQSVSRIRKAKAEEWIDGLPPIESMCECKYKDDNKWRGCEIFARNDHETWMYINGNGSSNLYKTRMYKFRPSKSGREKELQDMKELVGDIEKVPTWSDALITLLDAGYHR